jgi:hypothetical protein
VLGSKGLPIRRVIDEVYAPPPQRDSREPRRPRRPWSAVGPARGAEGTAGSGSADAKSRPGHPSGDPSPRQTRAVRPDGTTRRPCPRRFRAGYGASRH